jgi:hypothetical protein
VLRAAEQRVEARRDARHAHGGHVSEQSGDQAVAPPSVRDPHPADVSIVGICRSRLIATA